MTYNWNFSCLECYPEKETMNDVVFLVHWQYTGKKTENEIEYSNTIIGTQSLPLPSGDFIPYEDLTKEIVTEWIESEMGEERLLAMQTAIEQNINDQINPPVLKLSPPWNK